MLPFRSLAQLAALSCLLAGSFWPDHAGARPRSGSAVGDVTVDVSRLRALGLGPTADLVGAAVAGGLRAGAGQLPSGGRIVVRLTGLSLNAYAGSGSGGGGGGGGSGGGGGGTGSGSDYDYLEGEILVVGPRGEILSQRPQLAALPSNSGGAYYLPDAERRRVIAISEHFAAWARRSSL